MCELCKKTPCHMRCPNYMPPNTKHKCVVCGDGIYEDEQYIENYKGEMRHENCYFDVRDVLEWLGYKIKTMGGE